MRLSHVLWNLLGLGVPLLIAALTVPGLLSSIGQERFGLLALAWGLIGYAGALDLGIGRAATQRIAMLRGGREAGLIPDVVASAVRLTQFTGAASLGLIVVAALLGAEAVVKADGVPTEEIRGSMLLLALALPLQMMSATYRGVSEAHLNFRGIGIVRMLLGAANFGAPFVVSLFTDKVYWLVATLVGSRAIALVFFRRLALQCMEGAGSSKGVYSGAVARRLAGFGGWSTLTTVLGMLMLQSDRFFIGALIGASAVSVYAIPYEVTIQTLIVTGAISSVIFPVVSQLIGPRPAEAMAVFRSWLLRVAILMTVVAGVLALSLPQLLRLWLGDELAAESVRVGQILCVGIVFCSIGNMHLSLLHAAGRTRATGIVCLLELPVYLALLLVLMEQYGVTGCAIAWSARAAIDAVALVSVSWKTGAARSTHGL